MTIANPIPPAAHTVRRPKWPSRRRSSFARVRVRRAPVAPKGVTEGDRAAHHVDPVLGRVPDGAASPQLPPRERLRIERLQVGEHLGREGLVHLHQVDLPHREARPVECGRHGVGRPLEELPAGVERRDRVAPDPGQGARARFLERALRHENHRSRAIRERGRIRRGHGSVPPVEDRAELRHRLEARGPADPVVALDDPLVGGGQVDGGDLGREPPVLRPRRGQPVGPERPPVLRLASDPVLLRHPFRRLTHRLAGRGLGDPGPDGEKVPRPDPGEGREAVPEGPGLRGRDEAARQPVGNRDGNVRERLGASGHDDARLPHADEVGAVCDRLVRGCTGPGDRVRGDRLRQDAEPHLARDVRGVRIVHDGPENELIDSLARQLRAGQRLAHRELTEIDRSEMPEFAP